MEGPTLTQMRAHRRGGGLCHQRAPLHIAGALGGPRGLERHARTTGHARPHAEVSSPRKRPRPAAGDGTESNPHRARVPCESTTEAGEPRRLQWCRKHSKRGADPSEPHRKHGTTNMYRSLRGLWREVSAPHHHHHYFHACLTRHHGGRGRRKAQRNPSHTESNMSCEARGPHNGRCMQKGAAWLLAAIPRDDKSPSIRLRNLGQESRATSS